MAKTLIIAEAGVNHNGSLELAKKLVDEAKKAGADIIKFQTGKAENIVSKFAQKAEYQKVNTGNEDSQFEMLNSIMLKNSDFVELKKYCDEIGIEFLSTPFDIQSIGFLEPMVRFWKIPSGEITNLPYLIEIAKTEKPVVMSTGMSEIFEIEQAVNVLKKYGTKKIALLHCNTQYPTPYSDVNLLAMKSLKEYFNLPVGYSDHTDGTEVSVAAVALGAEIIEKHFTLDKNMQGPDHKASLEPTELSYMVNSIRNIEKSLGNGVKSVSASEFPNKNIARKSIVAMKAIRKGEIFTTDNITTKRPGNGISPMRWFDVIGTEAIRDFKEDELIEII